MNKTEFIQKFEKLAKAATPGKWYFNSYSVIYSNVGCVARRNERHRNEQDCDDKVTIIANLPPSYGDTSTDNHNNDAWFIEFCGANRERILALMKGEENDK